MRLLKVLAQLRPWSGQMVVAAPSCGTQPDFSDCTEEQNPTSICHCGSPFRGWAEFPAPPRWGDEKCPKFKTQRIRCLHQWAAIRCWCRMVQPSCGYLSKVTLVYPHLDFTTLQAVIIIPPTGNCISSWRGEIFHLSVAAAAAAASLSTADL